MKESAFGRRQELPAGTGAAPLCQPLKCGADYRDVTASLKMKRSRRLCGDRRTFLAVAVAYSLRRRREEGVCSHIVLPSPNEGTISNAEVTDCDKNVLCRERHERVAIMYRCEHLYPRLTPHLLGLVLIFVSSKQKLKKKTFVQRRTFYKQIFLVYQ